jgi:N-acetylglutamate synthase-like GNAT family acetyltransferase
VDIEFADDEIVPIRELVDLYEAVGWLLYASDPDRLALAIDRSTYVVTARVDGELVGLARSLSDEVAVLYLQEVLVRPDHHRRGIGATLITKCLDRFSHVPQKVLLSDGDDGDQAFARALGFKPAAASNLTAFVRRLPDLD